MSDCLTLLPIISRFTSLDSLSLRPSSTRSPFSEAILSALKSLRHLNVCFPYPVSLLYGLSTLETFSFGPSQSNLDNHYVHFKEDVVYYACERYLQEVHNSSEEIMSKEDFDFDPMDPESDWGFELLFDQPYEYIPIK